MQDATDCVVADPVSPAACNPLPLFILGQKYILPPCPVELKWRREGWGRGWRSSRLTQMEVAVAAAGAGGGAEHCPHSFIGWPSPPGEWVRAFRLKVPNNQQFSPGKLTRLIKQFPLSSLMFCFQVILNKIEMIWDTGINYLPN